MEGEGEKPFVFEKMSVFVLDEWSRFHEIRFRRKNRTATRCSSSTPKHVTSDAMLSRPLDAVSRGDCNRRRTSRAASSVSSHGTSHGTYDTTERE